MCGIKDVEARIGLDLAIISKELLLKFNSHVVMFLENRGYRPIRSIKLDLEILILQAFVLLRKGIVLSI
jgi:hypothetical protein